MKSIKKPNEDLNSRLDTAIYQASQLIQSHQFNDGYWWYTLEANDSINAEYILLRHYLGIVDGVLEPKICEAILRNQRADGSWALYYDGPGDVSTSIECYFALKMSGFSPENQAMKNAREFILKKGGLPSCRVFTRIHLAQFGIIPWSLCPTMPAYLIHLPSWAPLSIYEFSSWARSTIVPLLIIMNVKKVKKLSKGYLDELYNEKNKKDCDWSYKYKQLFSIEHLFIKLDKILANLDKIPIKKPFEKNALKKCEEWIREHLARTEDIYPAMAYGALALSNLGYSNEDPIIKKALKGLESFQLHVTQDKDINALPCDPKIKQPDTNAVYQQCCISPVWDTAWAAVSLLEVLKKPNEALYKTANWLISKQVTDVYGDWSKKNKKGKPGGWSFEFENVHFPDVDDTIEILTFLLKMKLTTSQAKESIVKGISWLLSMQSKNGGWAAFDVNNTKEILNRIPFSDHGACLDQPTPDLTGRMIEFLSQLGLKKNYKPIKRAINFIEKKQSENGAWWGRWGVNYLYGTWCVLYGLKAVDYDMTSARIIKTLTWLKSIQNKDGGFGEDCHSYLESKYKPLHVSTPSQTAWALMSLIAAGASDSIEAMKACDYLINQQNSDGSWNENHFTGTGFPGHFYIRYHGYRYYFPMMALNHYQKAISTQSDF